MRIAVMGAGAVGAYFGAKLAAAGHEVGFVARGKHLEAMEKDSGIPIKELRVDGGMVANELLMQFQADQLGVAVVRPRVTETTALGAAYAAGLAVGYWSSRAELVRNWGVERRWQPAMAEPQRAKLYSSWQKAVRRSFDWVDRPA